MKRTHLNTFLTIAFTSILIACGGGGGEVTDPLPSTNTLTISKAGTGNGTVASSPSGIDCGPDCSESYAVNTPVTLDAIPDAGSEFSGWEGDTDCTDGNVIVVTDITCIVIFDSTLPLPEANLFFKSGSISMVDPDNPSSPVVIESGNTLGELQLVDASFDTTSQQITGKHIRTIIYANTDDGKLYRVSTLKSDAQPPIPVQVSSETEADKMCKTGLILGQDLTQAHSNSDYSDHTKSVYLYELPGPDDNCSISSDNEWKMIRLGMSDTENPIPAKQPFEALYDKTTGKIIGFLAKEGPKLVRCDQDFSVCSDIITSATGTFFNGVVLVSNPFTGHIMLQVDGTLYSYNVFDDILSSPLHALNTTAFQNRTDGSHFYFSNGGQLLKVPMDGSELPTILSAETDHIYRVELTNNRVVYGTLQTGTFPGIYNLKSINKSGGTAISLAASVADSVQVLLFGATGDFVYYNELKLGGQAIAGTVKDDGTGKTEQSKASWVGPTTAISGNFAPLTKIIRAEDCVGLTCDLKSYDAASNGGEIFLGTSDFRPTFDGIGSSLLGFDVVDIGPSGVKTDMFFVDLDRADSLIRLTITSDINEFNIPISE